MYENLCVIGYVAKVSKKNGDKPYLRLSISVSAYGKGTKDGTEEKTNWYSVTLWDKQAAHYSDRIKKGDFVLASGTPEIRLYTVEGEKRVDVSIKTDFSGTFRVLRYAAGSNPANQNSDL
jgi:single-stranded DNA-binding protein